MTASTKRRTAGAATASETDHCVAKTRPAPRSRKELASSRRLVLGPQVADGGLAAVEQHQRPVAQRLAAVGDVVGQQQVVVQLQAGEGGEGDVAHAVAGEVEQAGVGPVVGFGVDGLVPGGESAVGPQAAEPPALPFAEGERPAGVGGGVGEAEHGAGPVGPRQLRQQGGGRQVGDGELVAEVDGPALAPPAGGVQRQTAEEGVRHEVEARDAALAQGGAEPVREETGAEFIEQHVHRAAGQLGGRFQPGIGPRDQVAGRERQTLDGQGVVGDDEGGELVVAGPPEVENGPVWRQRVLDAFQRDRLLIRLIGGRRIAAAGGLPDAEVRLGALADCPVPLRPGLPRRFQAQPVEEGGPFGGDVGRLFRRLLLEARAEVAEDGGLAVLHGLEGVADAAVFQTATNDFVNEAAPLSDVFDGRFVDAGDAPGAAVGLAAEVIVREGGLAVAHFPVEIAERGVKRPPVVVPEALRAKLLEDGQRFVRPIQDGESVAPVHEGGGEVVLQLGASGVHQAAEDVDGGAVVFQRRLQPAQALEGVAAVHEGGGEVVLQLGAAPLHQAAEDFDGGAEARHGVFVLLEVGEDNEIAEESRGPFRRCIFLDNRPGGRIKHRRLAAAAQIIQGARVPLHQHGQGNPSRPLSAAAACSRSASR